MKEFILKNVDCAVCGDKIERELKKLDSVKDVNFSFATNSLFIESSNLQEVENTIKKIEPNAKLESKNTESKISFFNAELLFLGILVFVFIASLIFFHLYVEENAENENLSIYFLILWIVIYLLAGREVIKGAFFSFKNKEFFDENILMLSASLAAFAIGAHEEAVSIMLFFSIGEYLQNISVARSKAAIGALSEFKKPLANKLNKTTNKYEKIEPELLEIGDEIIVYPGEMLSNDGILLDSSSSVDCKALSGESLPVEKKLNEEVLSGSIALSKPIKIKVTKKFKESQISKITDLIKNATLQKSQTENFITTFARFYTPVVFVIALLTAIIPPLLFFNNDIEAYKDWIYRALVVLMVSCPCALVVSVPIGYFGGLAAASKYGVLIKGSNFLEAMSRLKLLCLDKTGTLTKGEFKVIEIIPESNVSKIEVLQAALCAQDLSSHPIAESIKKEYQKLAHNHHLSEFEELSGMGVRAVCDGRQIIAGNDKILHKFDIEHNTCSVQGSVLHISVDKKYLGYILIADTLKDDAKQSIEGLKQLNITPIILSGDSHYACEVIANKIGCEFFSELSPIEKSDKFKELKQGQLKGKVGFAGDGMNDAPTLALADVGISMGSGSDISKQNADVIILNNSLDSLLKGIKVAKKTKRIIYENIILALSIKGVFIILGFAGVAGIWEAVFGDVGVALLALANAMRAMRL